MITLERHPLITPDDFRALAREVSVHTDDSVITQYIRECEDMYIIPAVGWPVMKAATVTEDWSEFNVDPYTLLFGGEYTVTDGCGCNGNGTFFCNGLRKALAYYVYAKMQRNDGNILARAGAMQHNDQYASHTNDSQLKRYNDQMDIAEKYLGECTAYLNAMQDNNEYKTRQTRCRIIPIGD